MVYSKNFVFKDLILGKIGSPYGVLGWLRLFSFTQNPVDIFNYLPWFVQKSSKYIPVELDAWKYSGKYLIIKIKGISERNLAISLTNSKIVISPSSLPILKSGEYYWKDLLGFSVCNLKGYQMGKVISFMENSVNDILVVKSDMKDSFGIKECLIPFIEHLFVKKVDIFSKVIEVDWDPDF